MIDSKSQLGSLSKAFDLLCCFSTERPEWGVTELAEYLGLCKSSIHRLLTTCNRYRFVERTIERRYRLGARTLELGNIYRSNRRLLSKVEPALRILAETTNSIAHLGEFDGHEILELARSAGRNSVSFTKEPCFRNPVHATGMGKILLAFGPKERQRYFLGGSMRFKRFTAHTILTAEDLRQEVQNVKQRGYAISDGETVIGCRCLAVPVRGPDGECIAALSISNTGSQLNDRVIPRILPQLFDCAGLIGRETIDCWSQHSIYGRSVL